MVYKGLLVSYQLSRFYLDLNDETMVSAFALVHSRFSTNTLGHWKLAHPYRYLAHNGEINTLRGNINWMHAREQQFSSPLYGDDVHKLAPICDPMASDTASFDNALELLVMTGRELAHAMLMMIPEAWDQHETMSQEKEGFLRVPFLHDGALGRAGHDAGDRRQGRVRRAGPQRLASVPLYRHPR